MPGSKGRATRRAIRAAGGNPTRTIPATVNDGRKRKTNVGTQSKREEAAKHLYMLLQSSDKGRRRIVPVGESLDLNVAMQWALIFEEFYQEVRHTGMYSKDRKKLMPLLKEVRKVLRKQVRSRLKKRD